MEDDCYTFLAHPELVGLRSNYLPSQTIEKDEYGTEVSNMAYTMDKHGYLESCIVTASGEGYEETIIYNFTWE